MQRARTSDARPAATSSASRSDAAPLPASAPAGTIWMNGRLLPASEARVSVFDRGFLFGDGVYEFIRFFDRIGVGMDLHVRRLRTSLRLTGIEGFDADTLPALCMALLDANGLADATIYVQVTRGEAAQRSHVPVPGMTPTVVAIATPAGGLSTLRAPEAVRAVLLPDQRWLRCEIKSTSLMGNVLAAMVASQRGADEAILHRDGLVSEGGSTNTIVASGGALATPSIADGPPILHGVSRAQALEAARGTGIVVTERRITTDELRRADEIMITSSRRLLSAVVELDGAPVGTGRAGPLALRLFELMRSGLHSAP